MSKKSIKRKHSGIKQTILAIAIALITVFFVAYAIQSIYPAPKYEDHCGRFDRPLDVTNEAECVELEGTWISYNEKFPEGREGYCDLYVSCQEDYDNAREPYEMNVFIINLILGLAILIGAFFLGIEAISTGFMGGGAILMIYGTIRYWSELNDVLRTFFLGIALAILVYFGYKKLKD